MIEVRLDRETVAVGDTLAGTLLWRSPNDKLPNDKLPTEARVTIGWYTEGRGTRNRLTAREIFLDLDRSTSARGFSRPFSLEVPQEGPITYNGALIRIIWELQVHIEMPGLFARSDKYAHPFQVLPQDRNEFGL